MSQVEQAQAIRLRHYQGQRLQANDLQAEFDNLTWLRGLHMVGLHDTWGIALGFEVVLASIGERFVTLVNPGLAYDRLGREIVLTHVRTLACPLPPAAAPAQETEYHLVMSYDADLGPRCAGQEVVPCTGQAGKPGREQPVFAWRRPDQVHLGLEVPLAALHLTPGSYPSLGPEVRCYTQPQARPHIVAGHTEPEQVWHEWQEELTKDTPSLLGYETRVDTSAAGFVATPYYLANLVTSKIGNEMNAAMAAVWLSQLSHTTFTFSILEADSTGFLFRIFPHTVKVTAHAPHEDQPPPPDPDIRPFSVLLSRFQVTWLGFECVRGCQPSVAWRVDPDFLHYLSTGLHKSIPL